MVETLIVLLGSAESLVSSFKNVAVLQKQRIQFEERLQNGMIYI